MAGKPELEPYNKLWAKRMDSRQKTASIALPLAGFGMSLGLIVNVYHKAPTTVLFFLFCIVVVFTLPWCRKSTRTDSPINFCIAVMCLVLEIFGMISGYVTYDTVLKRYEFFEDAWFYTNVLPSDAAAGYVDAGKIVFADEAKLDFGHTIGFKDKTVYCVTPVLDDTGLAGKVQFWAAGTDCCGPRSGFVCDDAWDPKARAGLVMNEETHSAFQGSIREHFMDAIRQAEVAYGIAAAEDPILVRWVVDPNKVQQNLWGLAFGMIFVASAFAMLLTGAGAIFISSGAYSMIF